MTNHSTPAYIDSSNHFREKKQYLGLKGDPNQLQVAGVRMYPSGTVYGNESPLFIGEMVICVEDHPTNHTKKNHVVYLGFKPEVTGWIKIGEESSTKPSTNHLWNSNETWIGGNRWIHYHNEDFETDGTWSHCDTWEDSIFWDC